MRFFKGRTSRTVFFLSLVCLSLLLVLFEQLFLNHLNSLYQQIIGILGIGFWFTLYFAVHTRRWHDIGKTGWLSLSAGIPFIGTIITTVLFFIPGDSKKNKYGEKPVSIRF